MGKKRSREFWARLIAEYETSGLTQVEFARRHRVAESSIQRWRSLLSRAGARAPERTGFVEVKADDGRPAVEVRLAGGVTIRFGQATDARLIADVAQHIARAGC